MKKYILIDTYNLFFRSLYTINDVDMDVCRGMCLHLLFSMIKSACDRFKPDCLIACRDGFGTWRKGEYPLYKANRIEKLDKRSPYEIERDEALKDVFENTFLPFIDNKTNIPLLGCPMAEADDLIARFIKLHPNDIVVILSTDNDFVQLLNDNVFLYNAVEERIISNKAIISTVKNQPLYFKLKDGKVSVPKEQPSKIDELVPYEDWVEYALFMKCIRGDKSDNIFSAYPGVREKSSKNKVGVRDAFLDRLNKGFNWTSFMNQTWTDAFGTEHTVYDDYLKNKHIIDLSQQPQELIDMVDEHIKEKLNAPNKSCVGINLGIFLKEWNLNTLNDKLSTFSGYFQKSYNTKID